MQSGVWDAFSKVRAWFGGLKRRPDPRPPSELIPVCVEGVVRSKGKGEGIFDAKVWCPYGRLKTQTDGGGKFSLTLRSVPKDSLQSLLVVSSNYWPHWVTFQASNVRIDLGNRCALDPVPDILKPFGVGLPYFGPKLIYKWYSSTWVEKMLAGLLLFFLIPTVVLFAIDRGLNIPGTDADEHIREWLQWIAWCPSSHPRVRFSKVRPIYYKGVSYQIIPGVHQVNDPEITIQEGSDVEI